MNLFTKKSVFSKGSYRVKHVDGLLERRQQGLVESNYEVKNVFLVHSPKS